MINDGFFTVLQVVTEFNQGGVIVQNDKYETQSADVRIVCNKEENGGTFSLSRLANVKFTQEKLHSHLLHGKLIQYKRKQ